MEATVKSPVVVIDDVLQEYGIGFDVAREIEKRLHKALKSVESDGHVPVIFAGDINLEWGHGNK